MDIINDIPQRVVAQYMNATPSIEEVNLALCKVRSGKTPGLGSIPVEILKAGGHHILSEINNLITRVWNEYSVLQEWINGILIFVYNGKGPNAVCGTSRGIAFLIHIRKILSRIMFVESSSSECVMSTCYS
eukprot:XP_014786581.1 PREDICTED: uncharacterized protein LOC106880925 [Octopus bimaculoides]